MNTFKVITYNISGIPQTVDLKELPWILRPIAWIYKLFKKTTVINVNKLNNRKASTLSISQCLSKLHPDIIGVQEDFNYHDELTCCIKEYRTGTTKGGFYPNKLFSSVDWFPYPRFKTDGLNILVNGKHNVQQQLISSEDIISWKKSSGYFKHLNDKVAKKGFRKYTLNINGEFDLDIYVLHMDAGSTDKDISARESQFKQLSAYILNQCTAESNPTIIMGDFNNTPNREKDVEHINAYFLKEINKNPEIIMEEAVPSNGHAIDRIFYINCKKSNYNINPIDCAYDYTFKGFSDHNPVVANFTYTKN